LTLADVQGFYKVFVLVDREETITYYLKATEDFVYQRGLS
jgi:hypothetical protein